MKKESKGLVPIDKIWQETDGGRSIIEDIYPQSNVGFTSKKNFKIRQDDKRASCSVFKSKDGQIWFIQDKGGLDNKAKNAITIIQDEQGLTYYDALLYIVQKYCKNLSIDSKISIDIKPEIRKSEKNFDTFTYETKEFSEFELKVLGADVSADTVKEFNCYSLKWYATLSTPEKPSYLIYSTENYPIYIFIYRYEKLGMKKDFYKIYQPYSQDFRFVYFGDKQTDYIFSDNKTAKLLEKARKRQAIEIEDKVDKLFLVSGPSDAMNLYANGHQTVWLNSETVWEKLSDYDFRLLNEICNQLYAVPDLDETGIRNATRLGLKFLDINIVLLPEDLKKFKTKGSICKDIKDFFNIYKNERYKNLSFLFDELVRISNPFRFWDRATDEEGNVKLNFSNERIYNFLQANGFFKHESIKSKKGWIFIHILNNIVKEIDEENISDYVNAFVVNFIKSNLMYHDRILIDKIHRSNDFKVSSLSKIKSIKLDFKAYDETSDHFFFQNCVWRITANGIEQYPVSSYKKYVWNYKVVDFHVKRTEKPLFNIEYSLEYKKLIEERSKLNRQSEQYEALTKQIDSFNQFEKYKLTINDANFSYIRYLYNTGRVYWEKEQRGEELTESEKQEQDLYFISKVCALGYILYRYKEFKKAYAIFATETAQNGSGEHHGGTGKSIYMQTLEWSGIRRMEYIDGQNTDSSQDSFVFGNVTTDTDYIFMEDLARGFNLHRFMNSIQGNMEVRMMYKQKFTISFMESPKIMINSNHTPYHLDPSLRRRLWFIGFCDYYHASDELRGIKEFTPSMEFPNDLVTGYKDDEKNLLYNFLGECAVTYLKFRTKIESPLESIMARNIQDKVGERFLDWADDYFTSDKLNVDLKRSEVWDSYIENFSDKEQKTMKNDKWFRERLYLYSVYKNYIFNPLDRIGQNIEDIKRQRIRRKIDNVWIEYIHYRPIETEIEPGQEQKYENEVNEAPMPF